MKYRPPSPVPARTNEQFVAEGDAGVASAHPLATQAGIDCLKAGGDAFRINCNSDHPGCSGTHDE
jgi:gamma-glutamyltranspeptidase